MTRAEVHNVIFAITSASQKDGTFPIVAVSSDFHTKMAERLVVLSSLEKLQWWEKPEILTTVRAALGRKPKRWEVKFSVFKFTTVE
jgi:hypothetical protein